MRQTAERVELQAVFSLIIMNDYRSIYIAAFTISLYYHLVLFYCGIMKIYFILFRIQTFCFIHANERTVVDLYLQIFLSTFVTIFCSCVAICLKY